MPNISIIADFPLQKNSVVQLKSINDNDKDRYAVAVMQEGVQVGWVANSENTIIEGTYCAMDVRSKWLDNPRCAAVTAVIRKSSPYTKKSNEGGLRYVADLYLVPIRDNTDVPEKTEEFEVAGLAAKHTENYRVKALFKDGKEKDAAMTLRMRPDASREVCCVYFADDCIDLNKSAGEVKEPTPTLIQQVRTGSVTAKLVRSKSRSKTGFFISASISINKNDMAKYYPAIDEAVSRGVAQSPVLEKRVMHMLQSNFTQKQIEAVLAQTPVFGAERANIPNPKTPYIQSDGTNLADAVSYMLRGKLVQLRGEKGGGKNTLIETACWLLGRPLCRVQGSDDISKMDFEGSRTLKDGSTEFELSEMFRTLQIGGVVVIDEVNMIRSNVLSDLHSLTDGSRSINVTGYGLVKMDPRACIVYTRNEGYVGTAEMNPATVDRGPVITVKQESNLAQLLAHAVPSAKQEDIQLCCKVAEAISKSIQENNTLTPDAVTIRGYIDALECLDDIPLKRSLLHNVANKLPEGPAAMAVETIIMSHCG